MHIRYLRLSRSSFAEFAANPFPMDRRLSQERLADFRFECQAHAGPRSCLNVKMLSPHFHDGPLFSFERETGVTQMLKVVLRNESAF
jgi:hypothetical protein